MFGWLKTLISPVTELGKSYMDGKTRIREAKINAEIAKYNRKADRLAQGDKTEADWDMEAQEQAKFSWKDEIIMTVWLAPFIALFFESTQPQVIAGFKALEETVPYGYWLVLFGIVAQSFGLRWLFAKRIDKAIGSMQGKS